MIIIMLGIVATTRLHVSQYCGVVRMHQCTTVNILTNIISMAKKHGDILDSEVFGAQLTSICTV